MSDRVRIHAAFTLHSFLGVTIRGSVVVHTRRLCSQHAWACSDAVVFKYRRGYPALVSSGLRRYSMRKYRVRWRTRPPSACYYRRFQTSQSSRILACRRRLGISGEHARSMFQPPAMLFPNKSCCPTKHYADIYPMQGSTPPFCVLDVATFCLVTVRPTNYTQRSFCGRKTQMSFQTRKNLHMIFLPLMVALCFHSVVFRYVGSILIVWYILDRMYFTTKQ